MKRRLRAFLLICLLLVFALPAGAAQVAASGNLSLSIAEDQMAFGLDHWLGRGDFFGDLLRESTPNVRTKLESRALPAKAKRLEISADYCGVLVEPSSTGKLELLLAGVKEADRDKFSVSLSTGADGVLRLTAKGDESLHFISMKEGALVNTVVLQFPAARLAELKLSAGYGMVRSFDLAEETTGKTGSGTLEIRDETVRGNCTMESESGDVKVSGSAAVSGKIRLTTENGDAQLKGGAVGGPVELRSSNGDSLLFADSVGQAALSTANGDALLETGAMQGDVTLTSGNGDVAVRFRKAPENLGLTLKAGNGDRILPPGWKNGYSRGSGSPSLTLESGNGDILVRIGQGK